jgi:hypothetical protein
MNKCANAANRLILTVTAATTPKISMIHANMYNTPSTMEKVASFGKLSDPICQGSDSGQRQRYTYLFYPDSYLGMS